MTGGTERFVVYICENGRVETHGGPYAPMKAKEVRDAMASHLTKNNYRDWNIPEDACSVHAVTREKLRSLKAGSDRNE